MLGAAAVAVLTAMLTLTARPAAAHDWLASSTPAAGQRFDTAPSGVTLVFSDAMLALGDEIVVEDLDGRDWVDGEPRLAGRELSVSLTQGMPASAYLIRWRVVSADGHPITGVIPFTVGAAASWGSASQPSTAPPGVAHTTDRARGEPATAGPLIPVRAAVVCVVVVVCIGVAGWLYGIRRRRVRARSEENDDQRASDEEREKIT